MAPGWGSYGFRMGIRWGSHGFRMGIGWTPYGDWRDLNMELAEGG
jgi:hypothetical protein